MLQFDEEAIYKAKFVDEKTMRELDITIKEPGEGVYDNLYDLIVYIDYFINFQHIQTIIFNNELLLCIDQNLGLFRSKESVFQIRLTEQFKVNEQHIAFLSFGFVMDSRMYKKMKDFNKQKKEEAATRQKEKDK